MKSLHSLFESKNIEFGENSADFLSSSDGGGTEHLENEDLLLLVLKRLCTLLTTITVFC